VECYKDEGGTIKYYGGGVVNQNAIQIKDPVTAPCGAFEKWSVIIPQTAILDYNIWPDLQGNCNILMGLFGNGIGQHNMLGYNKVFKTKKNAQVNFIDAVINSAGDTAHINYTKGDVNVLYKRKNTSRARECGGGASGTIVTWTDDILLANGFLLLDIGAYEYNYPKGITVATDGNINVKLFAFEKRTLVNNTTVSNATIQAIVREDEKYDSIPYQLTSNADNPAIYGYNVTYPTTLNLVNYLRDTLIGESIYPTDFSLATGSNQVYAAAMGVDTGTIVSSSLIARKVRLQHLAVERINADSFAVRYKTNTNKGVVIGKEIQTLNGADNIAYDFPYLAVNNNGNAIFYTREYGSSVRVSPIINGAELAWGAMGRAIGTGLFNNSYYYPDQPSLVVDPLNGTGLVSWQDYRTVPANNSSLNIFMRHLDNLLVPGYTPPRRKIQPLSNFNSAAWPVALVGSSNNYSPIEALNATTGITSPVAEILDNYNLGNVSVKMYEHVGPVRTTNGKPYLNRNYTIKPENNPNGAANINLRLFFTTAQFDALKAADAGIINPGYLSVLKQPNSTLVVPATYTPIAGETEVIPVSWKAIDGGYYIEIVVTGFSNFFIQKSSAPLPLTWLGVQAKWQNVNQAKISWQVADQQNIKEYKVEHSTDAVTYTPVCTITASNSTDYNCIVPADNTAKNYYRVMELDADGKKTYSNVVLLLPNAKTVLAIYPNPVKDKLYITGLADYGSIKITSINGSIVLQQNIVSGLKYIDISRLNTGMYVLTVTNDKETKTLKIFKQ
jgi:hypothetical protein